MTANEPQSFRIDLDYPVHPRPRYGHGRPPHARLAEIIGRRRDHYVQQLQAFAPWADAVSRIPVDPDPSDPRCPHWNNGWFEGIDALSLYCFLATQRPARYCEVGSGHSTKFAARAIADQSLSTTVTSIDPSPRAEIDGLCDAIIRSPLEDLDPDWFVRLEEGDILFVDDSHRVFMNSDVTVFFLEVLPRLRAGVLVGIHDIMLPQDYPPTWGKRYYSEQYLLAAYLLAEGSKFDIVLPSSYVGQTAELRRHLDPIWSRRQLRRAQPYGSSFWIRTRESE